MEVVAGRFAIGAGAVGVDDVDGVDNVGLDQDCSSATGGTWKDAVFDVAGESRP